MSMIKLGFKSSRYLVLLGFKDLKDVFDLRPQLASNVERVLVFSESQIKLLIFLLHTLLFKLASSSLM